MVCPGLLLLLFGAPGISPGSGHVQFKSVPGVRIRLEGRDVGETSGEDGLVVREVASGARRYEAHLTDYASQFGVVMVEPDAISVKRLEAWQPLGGRSADERPSGYGTLIVETLPVDATIQARHLGWNDKVEKGDRPFIARNLPAGRRKFTFCNESKCMDYWVKIEKSAVTKLLIDFDPGEIFDLSRDFAAEWKSASKKCGEQGDLSACKLACQCDSSLTPDLHSLACDLLNQQGRPADPIQVSSAFTPPDTCGIDPNGDPGILSILSRRTVTVFAGGEELGRTPIEKRPIAAGCHDLTAVTADGKRHALTVRVEPGQERRIKLTF